MQGLKLNAIYSARNVYWYIAMMVSYLFYPDANRWRVEIDQLKNVDNSLAKIIMDFHASLKNITMTQGSKATMEKKYKKFAHELYNWSKTKEFW